jgi:hypothetical protein
MLLAPVNSEPLRASILTLVCSKCLRAKSFGVGTTEDDKREAARAIARAGWVKRGELTVCPRCPQTIEERLRRVHAESADAK